MPPEPRRAAYRLFFFVRLLCSLAALALFVRVYTSSLQRWSGTRVFLMELQFTGALVRGGAFSLIALAVLAVTALAGRWYCSILCPLGTLQEAVWRIVRLITGRKTRFISPARLRYAVPVLAAAGIVVEPSLFALTDPISNFGRGARSVYTVFTEGVFSVPSSVWVFLGIFAFILAMAVARGRRFCDWCPAGILLGAFAPVAPIGMRMRKYACVSCGKCELACPMNCIDANGKEMDEARCVLCFGCARACGFGALVYGSSAVPAERRAFLRKGGGALASFAGVIYLGGRTVRRMFPGLAENMDISGRIPLIMPPGARNFDLYRSNCVGCQACVAACPANIVRVDAGPYPIIDFSGGYCQYNCVECVRACPTGALYLEEGMKQLTRIGISALDSTRCVVITRGEACGACAEVCPPRALRMEPLEAGSHLTAPVFDEAYCIGCGGCFHVCPAEPNAFEVTGVTPQILTPGMRPSGTEDYEAEPFSGGDFPF